MRALLGLAWLGSLAVSTHVLAAPILLECSGEWRACKKTTAGSECGKAMNVRSVYSFDGNELKRVDRYGGTSIKSCKSSEMEISCSFSEIRREPPETAQIYSQHATINRVTGDMSSDIESTYLESSKAYASGERGFLSETRLVCRVAKKLF
jgi:hypothetical protein